LLEAGFKLTLMTGTGGKAEQLIRYARHGRRKRCGTFLRLQRGVVVPSDDEAVLKIYRGPVAVANAQRGSLVIDMSTVYPETSHELAKTRFRAGVDVLDVTIIGEYSGCSAGGLDPSGGGDLDASDAAESDLFA